MPSHWVILSRPDCSLCDAMYGDLRELLGFEAPIQIADISGDAPLEAKYGTRLPVLLADGEFVCAYRLDAERVRGYLDDGEK